MRFSGRLLTVAAGMSALLAACGLGGSPDESTPASASSAATTPPAVPTTNPQATPDSTTSSAPTPGGGTGTSQPETLAWGPTVEVYERAESIVADMALKDLAGQVIVARYDGLEPPTELIADLGLGGVIVMGDNVDTLDQLRRATEAVRGADDREYPHIVAVDQEGGTVARVREPATEFPSYMTFGAARDMDLTTDVARASGQELRALGFTTVFAPDADVTTGPNDPTIGSRSASSNPDLVADVVTASLEGYADAGIVAVPKHFPGHGSVPADSHEELPVQQAGIAELAERDFIPFQAAVDAGAQALMVAHIDLRSVDRGVPSSLSEPSMDLLRSDLGFEGLVFTDAQDMAAITETYGSGAAAVRSLQAGADVVLMPADVRAAHAAIVEAVEEERLPAERLEQAATRGIATMLHQQNSGGPEPDTEVIGSHDKLSYRASLSAMTIAVGECEGPYVGDTIRVVGGTERDRARLSDAARDADLDVGSDGDVVRLLGTAQPGDGDVVVSLDVPYGLGASEASTAKIALYGRTREAFEALVDVLVGAETAHGRLPVRVDGAEQLGCPSPP